METISSLGSRRHPDPCRHRRALPEIPRGSALAGEGALRGSSQPDMGAGALAVAGGAHEAVPEAYLSRGQGAKRGGFRARARLGVDDLYINLPAGFKLQLDLGK